MKIRLGLIGLGGQVRGHYLPYLEDRRERQGDVEVAWIGGYLEPDAAHAEPLEARGYRCVAGMEAWGRLLDGGGVDGVVVSLPNALHAGPIGRALEGGTHVAVDKPPTVCPRECARLAGLADARGLVFATLSQRRYEEVYRVAARHVRGDLGEPILISYMIAHPDYDGGQPTWRARKSLAGGGALIDSGYHGLDTIFWMLGQCEPPVVAESVSARWVRRIPTGVGVEEKAEVVESTAVVRVVLSNKGILSAAASREGPVGSVDEHIKIFGTRGTLRVVRERLARLQGDMSAATLSYQSCDGHSKRYDTTGWQGARSAPLEDFIDTLVERGAGRSRRVQSPARDSVQTLRVIELAYASAEANGEEIRL